MTTPDSPLDDLWKEYAVAFNAFDDTSLARWLAQTLGQLEDRAWRLSHPLVGAYRLAAQVGHDRQIWFKRLATPPRAYAEAPCCRAPLLPLFSRDIVESGLVCLHCFETAVAFEDIPADLQPPIRAWAGEYAPIHAVAHWEEPRQRRAGYNKEFEDAARSAEKILARAGRDIVPRLLEFHPAIVWEDHDECLEVRPEDIAI